MVGFVTDELEQNMVSSQYVGTKISESSHASIYFRSEIWNRVMEIENLNQFVSLQYSNE